MGLMCFGLFVFELTSAPFQKESRQSQWRWVANEPTGSAPQYQFIGTGEDSLTLSGVLMPEITGGGNTLEMLRQMAAKGEPYLLMRGNGEILGYWLLQSITEERTFLLADGTPQKIEFSLALKKYSESGKRYGTLNPFLAMIKRLF